MYLLQRNESEKAIEPSGDLAIDAWETIIRGLSPNSRIFGAVSTTRETT